METKSRSVDLAFACWIYIFPAFIIFALLTNARIVAPCCLIIGISLFALLFELGEPIISKPFFRMYVPHYFISIILSIIGLLLRANTSAIYTIIALLMVSAIVLFCRRRHFIKTMDK